MGVQDRKEREFLRREREILDAALALFSQEDWQGVTVEQIAERAEIGKGTVYKHFASKDEIYARLAAEFQERAVQKLEAIDPNQPVLNRLRKVIECFWEQHAAAERYQHLVQFCERDDFRKSLSPEAQEEMARLDARFQEAINRVLEDGIAQGILPQKSPQELTLGPMAALQGGVKLLWGGCMCAEPRPDAELMLRELTNFILAGMLYQEWLAEEGLADGEVTRRAVAELRAAEAELETERVSGGA